MPENFGFISNTQWGDFNWENLTLLVRRSLSTAESAIRRQKLRGFLFRLIRVWLMLSGAHRQRSLHPEACDWVSANRKGKPRWQESILRHRIKPAAVRVGVGKIGWHTFRHSYSCLLRRVGADIKVQQDLLRHSTIQCTMNVYTQAMSEGKRAANSVIVRSVLPCETCCGIMGTRSGSEREPMGTEKLLSGCGGWICSPGTD